MSSCIACGSEEITTRCGYCRDPVCKDHRLPEAHDCPALLQSPGVKDSTPAAEGIKSPEPMDLGTNSTTNTPTRDVGDSYGEHSRSLDVNPDGSISGEPTPEPQERGWSAPKPDRYTAETWALRIRNWSRTLVRTVAIAAVALGAVNMLLAPFIGGAYFEGYRTLLPVVTGAGEGIIHLADVMLMAIGAVVAWIV